jgi:FKBP-type peptidyl-prolyl cis-trans isomerase
MALIGLASCASPPSPSTPEPVPVAARPAAREQPPIVPVEELEGSNEPELTFSDTGLGTVELRLGDGESAAAGMFATVHYVGRHEGRIFDSSRERERAFRFEIGAETVIPGWDEGVVGMRVGGLRRLLVPPQLGYGTAGYGDIPGEAILEFEIELIALEPPPP